METNQQFKINRYIFLACIIVFALLLMYSMLAFLTAFLGSVILYVLCKPVMNWLVEKKQWKKGLAATIIIIVSFFIFLLPVLFAGGLLYKEVSIIVSNPSIIIEPLKELDNLLQQQFHITVFICSKP
jgi:predicted PurR-regulated permease PerM